MTTRVIAHVSEVERGILLVCRLRSSLRNQCASLDTLRTRHPEREPRDLLLKL